MFLSYFVFYKLYNLFGVIFADAGYLAKKKYFELTPNNERSSEEITAFMNVTMDAKRVKLDSSLAKHLPIADPSLGHDFWLKSNNIMIYVMKS